MGRSNDVAGLANAFLADLSELLFGCSHRKTTFPITIRTIASAKLPETYVACLDCGRHLAYDWSAMCISGRWDNVTHRERLRPAHPQSEFPRWVVAGGSR